MATQAFEDIVEDFEFLDDWEDRYRYVIEKGKEMEPLDPALRVPATKVEGCASQVWLHPTIESGRFRFDGESDAVTGMLGALEDLEGRGLAADLPELDEPLQVLRRVRKERQD